MPYILEGQQRGFGIRAATTCCPLWTAGSVCCSCKVYPCIQVGKRSEDHFESVSRYRRSSRRSRSSGTSRCSPQGFCVAQGITAPPRCRASFEKGAARSASFKKEAARSASFEAIELNRTVRIELNVRLHFAMSKGVSLIRHSIFNFKLL